MTIATVAKFEKLTECFIKQYSKYFIIGPDGERHYINAQLTLGEDGADSGGLAQAFDAWKKRLDNKTDTYGNFNLPALNYTREQLFFIAFGQGWAREATPLENVRRIRIDPHSPTSFRVIGTLSNSVEFNKAFNCPVGSRMNRAEKCKIW